MLSSSVVSALNELSVTFTLLPDDSLISRSYSILECIYVNLVGLLSAFLRLNYLKPCAYYLLSAHSTNTPADKYLYDGYDGLLYAFFTPRRSNYLISSDLYSRASFQSLFLHRQSPALRVYRLLYYFRSIFIENIIYRTLFNKVFFVSYLDTLLYNRNRLAILPYNGTRLPFTLDEREKQHLFLQKKVPSNDGIKVLFTGNYDQLTHFEFLLDCLSHLPIKPYPLSITIQSSVFSAQYLALLDFHYPHLRVVGKVPDLDAHYSMFDFIVFTNRVTTGIQTKYLHAFRAGALVLAPQSTAADFGPELINNKNIILYDSYAHVYNLITDTYYSPSRFNSIRYHALRFYENHHSFSNTRDFVRHHFLNL